MNNEFNFILEPAIASIAGGYVGGWAIGTILWVIRSMTIDLLNKIRITERR